MRCPFLEQIVDKPKIEGERKKKKKEKEKRKKEKKEWEEEKEEFWTTPDMIPGGISKAKFNCIESGCCYE